MNIQDVADFLDLVKNPEKYDRVLKNLVDEQARLKAVIETVGKVSDINTLLKQAQDKEAKLEAAYKVKAEQVEKQAEEDVVTIGKLKAKLQKDLEQSTKAAEDLAVQVKDVATVRADLAKREKALVLKENALADSKITVDNLVAEYNEKVAKLRSVMS